jgi:hypothetical protein
MKTKKIKATKIWHYGTRFNAVKRHADNCASMRGEKVSPVYAIPADAASVKAMVGQMAEAMRVASDNSGPFMLTGEEIASAALASIGINARAPKS